MKGKLAALITLGIFYLGGVYGLARMLGISSMALYWFMAIMMTLGLSLGGMWLWIKSKFKKTEAAGSAAAGGMAGAGAQAGPGGAPGQSEEVSAILKEAEARLATSRVAPGSSLANMPVIFLVGDQGTTKTSTMVNSGIEPDLLAGNVYQDNLVTPTRGANFWFARNAVWVEAGGKLLGEPQKWLDLVRRLRPKQLKTVAKGGQAPRAAVLCFSCEAFLQPNAADLMQAAGRYLQARLAEISEHLGISFPVYVLFTKTDQIQHFQEYVRNLSREEAMQVFGMTMPMRPATGGVYAEEETRRLTQAFNLLFYSLADKRILLLPRETDLTKLPAAYEFPREFRKLRNYLVQFLVDVCRPSQLRTSPFLRGFYFSGVRPITVTEATPAMRGPNQQDLASAASTIFRMPVPQMNAAPQMVARRVPQWMFLSHLLNDIVLQDRAAFGASETSTRTSKTRRWLLSIAGAFALLCLLFATISFFRNQSMLGDARAAANSTPRGEIPVTTQPTLGDLKQLESLRQSLARMTDYEKNGRPFMMGWGLYAGSSALPHVYQIYYDRFRGMLLGQLQGNMLDLMTKLPSTRGPNDEFGGPYDTVKAYLLTTREHKRIPAEVPADWLAGRLLDRWTALHPDAGDDRLALAKTQFDFFAKGLGEKNPYGPGTTKSQEDSIDHAQYYLSLFSGAEAVYRSMLNQLARVTQKVRYYERFPEGAGVVLVTKREVDGPFTKDGWGKFAKLIKEGKLVGEPWVLGTKYTGQTMSRDELLRKVMDLYTLDYVRQWQDYIKGTHVAGYGGARDAATKLGVMARGNGSPLLGVFWLAANNTNVGDPRIDNPFKSVSAVVPPSDAQVLIGQGNTAAYNGKLGDLQSFISVAADSKDPAIGDQTRAQAENAKGSVRAIESGLPIDADVHLEKQVSRILYEPIDHLGGIGRQIATGDLNQKGGQLCQKFNALMAKYPFNPKSSIDATVQEVDSLLKPVEGFMWQFYESDLKKGMTCTGATCTANPGSNLNPAFVSFFNRLNEISWAFYRGQQRAPTFQYTLRAMKSDGTPNVTFAFDGQELKATAAGGETRTFTWPGTPPSAKMGVSVGGGSLADAYPYDGVWAVFHLFGEAESFNASGDGYDVSWTVRLGAKPLTIGGVPVVVRTHLNLMGAPPFFRRDYFGGIRCVPTVAR